MLENINVVSNALETADDFSRQLAFIALGLIGAWLLFLKFFLQRSRLGVDIRLAACLGLFLVWACLSWMWADDGALTARRLIVLMLLMIAATGFAVHCSLKDIAWFGLLSGLLLVAGGALSELLLGTFRPLSPDYRFAGLLNPIRMAETSSIAILSAIALAHRFPKLRSFMIASSIVLLGVVTMTRSRGPLASLLLALAVYALLSFEQVNRARHRRRCLACNRSALDVRRPAGRVRY